MKINLLAFKMVYLTALLFIAACNNTTPSPTTNTTATTTSSLTPFIPSSTPSLITTITPSLTTLPTPDFCNLVESQSEIQVASSRVFVALEPGGPTIFDRILEEQNPAWVDFRQFDHGEMRSAGVIFHETAFGPELGTGVSPAVILVTYGVERNWELPADGDLVSDVDHIRAVLRQHESDWILGIVDQSQYPVANAATYALYRYFDSNLTKLEDWCLSYVQIYDESPLK